MPSPGFDSLSDDVEQRVLEILDLDEAEQAGALEALYREHPEQADAVRAWLRSMDRSADGSVVRSDAGPSSTWRELVEQLRSRGPAWTRYVFEGEIARGGMGVVHRVHDQDAHRSLALKVILGQGEATPTGDTPPVDDRSLGRFLEEAQVASQLDHPGIVPVHEIGVDGEGRVYFTMKLVQGQDLRAVFDMAHTGRDGWSETRVLNVLLRVCEAMAYAHAKGVIHRDLKPANVMVGKFGEVYVMDWGLARVFDRVDDGASHADDPSTTVDRVRSDRKARSGDAAETPLATMDGDVVGTPSYMPPEQAEGRLQDIGPASDVYAVGAMLYHALSGRMPYVRPGASPSPQDLLLEVVAGSPEPLDQLRPDVTPELLAIVEKAMAHDLSDRYADMTALARDVRACLENRVVAAYESGAWAELRKWVQRNKAITVTGLTALVVVGALGFWSNLTIRAGRNTAEAERDRVLRLSDKRRLDVLLSDADRLWPAYPVNAGPLRGWLARADELLVNLPLHEAALAEVRARGTPLPHPKNAERDSFRAHLARHAAGEAVDGEEFADAETLGDHIADLEAALESLEITVARARDHDFGQDAGARWWHDAVRDLVVGLHGLRTDDVHGATVRGVEARLEWAETVAERTTTGPDVAAKWDDARRAIRAHPRYGGLDLKPQLGLVPLGPDPDSTLWEFGHPRTGDLPTRDPDTGRLEISDATGLVFVLIPTGTYRVGAQKDDPTAAHFDPQAESDESPVHDVTLSAFFLSKYEMTQGAWTRVRPPNPSFWRPNSKHVLSLRHPVENVSWDDCLTTLSRLGLTLPTESQWEAACRAGTDTPWSTGRKRESLIGFANVPDQAAKKQGAPWPQIAEWPNHDDGFCVHAPVGSYRANELGLHDMHGNVWEWCMDKWSASAYDRVQPDARDGLRDVSSTRAPYRVHRGGSFSNLAVYMRSASRERNTPEYTNLTVGVRPTRPLAD